MEVSIDKIFFFSLVRLQLYRGIKVAVKEFRPHTICEDVKYEATILATLNLPYVFGVCTRSRPHRIVMQFHGIDSETVTLYRELSEHPIGITQPMMWLVICVQVLEPVQYIHSHKILHNDIKSNNILITTSPFGSSSGASIAATGPSALIDVRAYDRHIVLIDFGKATMESQSRRHHLSESEKVEYLVKFPHIAPEVVHGESRQTTRSDMFSIGNVLQKMLDYDCFRTFPNKTKEEILKVTNCLKSIRWERRPCAERTIAMIDKLMV